MLSQHKKNLVLRYPKILYVFYPFVTSQFELVIFKVLIQSHMTIWLLGYCSVQDSSDRIKTVGPLAVGPGLIPNA